MARTALGTATAKARSPTTTPTIVETFHPSGVLSGGVSLICIVLGEAGSTRMMGVWMMSVGRCDVGT